MWRNDSNRPAAISGSPAGIGPSRRRLLLLTLLALTAVPELAAQTTVYLRYGGPFTRKAITSIRPGTPPLITSPKHGFVDGDKIAIHGVSGMPSVSGIRVVTAATEDTFQVTELSGAPVEARGVWENKGWAGKVQEVTLTPHPRLLLDGPDGALTARVKDPDGAGPLKAPAARTGWVPWDSLIRRYDGLSRNPQSAFAGPTDAAFGYGIFTTSIGWFADNSLARYRDAAKLWLNRLEGLFSYNAASPFFSSCREDVIYCGTDTAGMLLWSGFYLAETSMAYSVLRNELSDAERKILARKIFNGFWDDQCDNRLRLGIGSVSVSAGSNKLSGEGTKFTEIPSPAGRWISVRDGATAAGTWYKIISVDSDTAMTVSKASPASAQGVSWFWEADWSSATCGAIWEMAHHSSMSNVANRIGNTTMQSPAGADQDTLTVANPAAFMQKPPFYVRVNTEWIKVNAIEGNNFKVERGQFFTKPIALRAGDRIASTDSPVGGSSGFLLYRATPDYPDFDAVLDNKNQVFLYGLISAGLAFADDEPIARDLLERAWNYWHDFVLYDQKAMWTGVQRGGFAYFLFWIGYSTELAAMGKTSFRPAIDLTDGIWLRRAHLFHIYASYPWSPRDTVMFSDDGKDPILTLRKFPHYPLGFYLFPDTGEARYTLDFLQKGLKYWSATEMGRPNNSTDTIPRYLIYTPPGLTCPSADCVDYTTLPPYYFFTETDNRGEAGPPNGYNAVISKQDWSTKATMVFVSAFGNPGDHMGNYPTPGTYRIGKAGAWLHASGPATQDGRLATFGSYVEVDGPTAIALPAQRKNTLGTYGPVIQVDQKLGSDSAVYWRVNSNNAFQPVASIKHHYRYFTHFKGDSDYLVVYDNVATTTPKRKLRRLFCFVGDLTPTAAAEAATRNGLELSCSKPEATLLSRVLLPADPAKLSDYAESTHTRVTLVDDGVTDSSEFLVVHHALAGKSGALPPTQLVNVSEGDFRGVWLNDRVPRLALFSRTIQPQSRLTFAVPFAGEGQIVVGGLAPGRYTVTRDGSPLPGEFIVRPEAGALSFPSTGGKISVVQTGGIVPLAILKTNLPTAIIGQAYNYPLQAEGGTLPYTWSLVSGSLPRGLALDGNGVIAGVPEGEEYSEFAVQVTDRSLPQEVQRASFSLSVTKPPPESLSILLDTVTPTMVGLRYGRNSLPADQACNVTLALDQDFQTVVDDYFDYGGPPFRELTFGWNIPLFQDTQYYLRATCGTDMTLSEFRTSDDGEPTSITPIESLTKPGA